MSESHAKSETVATDKKEEMTKTSGSEEKPQNEEEEIDIDLNDPEVEAAAAKIQSAFKNRKGFGKK